MAEAIPDNDQIKKRATRRLLVAVALVGILAGALTWLSQYKAPQPPIATQPTPDSAIAPPVIAPEPSPVIAAPNEPLPLEQAPAPDSPPAAPAAAQPVLPPTLGAPPPPKVVSKPLPPPGPGPKTSTAKDEAKPLVKADTPAPTPTPAAATTPTPTPATAAQAAPAPTGYVVQFGVFANTQNALQLVERLKQAGINAQTETRVQLPPFKSKAEAEAAMAAMKGKGINAVVVAR